MIAESNPPDEDSDWYIRMELEQPANWRVYKQPGGFDPGAENIENLAAGLLQRLEDVQHARLVRRPHRREVWQVPLRPGRISHVVSP